MNRTAMITATWVVASILAACSSDKADLSGTAAARPAAPKGDAPATQVAREMRGDLDCPPDIATAARAASAPVDDLLGVRPGLLLEEAANLVMCSGELLVVTVDTSARFNINTYGTRIRQGFSARNAKPRVTKTSQQYMREMSDEFTARSGNAVRHDLQPGESKWYVSTMGLPGQERVISAAREEWFASGRNPTVDSVTDALTTKYGPPTRMQAQSQHVYITWVHDTQGRFVPENSPLAHQCSANPDPDGAVSFSPECGVVVVARVQTLRENPAIAQFMQVSVADQSGGYSLITGTEQRLEAGEMLRRAQQVQDASRNADQPRL